MLIAGPQVNVPGYRHAESRIHGQARSGVAKEQDVQLDPAAAGQPLIERRVVLDRMQSENAKPWSRKPYVLAGAVGRATRSVREPSCADGSGLERTIATIRHTSQVRRMSPHSIIHISHASCFDYKMGYKYNNKYPPFPRATGLALGRLSHVQEKRALGAEPITGASGRCPGYRRQ